MLLLLRSVVVGLVAGCVVLLVGISPKLVLIQRPARVVHALKPSHAANATIVDVAGGVSASAVASLLKLEPGEHIAQVGDIHVANDIDAGTEIGLQWHGRDGFFDLDVVGPHGHRRVLVLIH